MRSTDEPTDTFGKLPAKQTPAPAPDPKEIARQKSIRDFESLTYSSNGTVVPKPSKPIVYDDDGDECSDWPSIDIALLGADETVVITVGPDGTSIKPADEFFGGEGWEAF